uniref:MIS18 binding protein 1 n=1 Tax=Myotis myotis TaxID=51298 RepID=A0A7J8AMX2_MYOMY|nr:MIS18 binding protein 1 [Myotis myotis]
MRNSSYGYRWKVIFQLHQEEKPHLTKEKALLLENFSLMLWSLWMKKRKIIIFQVLILHSKSEKIFPVFLSRSRQLFIPSFGVPIFSL